MPFNFRTDFKMLKSLKNISFNFGILITKGLCSTFVMQLFLKDTTQIHVRSEKRAEGRCVRSIKGVSVTVPGLRLSKVQVVDAVQIHVLCVPREGTLPHPKIEVRCVHSFDLDPTLVLYRVQNGVEAADVPLSHIL